MNQDDRVDIEFAVDDGDQLQFDPEVEEQEQAAEHHPETQNLEYEDEFAAEEDDRNKPDIEGVIETAPLSPDPIGLHAQLDIQREREEDIRLQKEVATRYSAGTRGKLNLRSFRPVYNPPPSPSPPPSDNDDDDDDDEDRGPPRQWEDAPREWITFAHGTFENPRRYRVYLPITEEELHRQFELQYTWRLCQSELGRQHPKAHGEDRPLKQMVKSWAASLYKSALRPTMSSNTYVFRMEPFQDEIRVPFLHHWLIASRMRFFLRDLLVKMMNGEGLFDFFVAGVETHDGPAYPQCYWSAEDYTTLGEWHASCIMPGTEDRWREDAPLTHEQFQQIRSMFSEETSAFLGGPNWSDGWKESIFPFTSTLEITRSRHLYFKPHIHIILGWIPRAEAPDIAGVGRTIRNRLHSWITKRSGLWHDELFGHLPLSHIDSETREIQMNPTLHNPKQKKTPKSGVEAIVDSLLYGVKSMNCTWTHFLFRLADQMLGNSRLTCWYGIADREKRDPNEQWYNFMDKLAQEITEHVANLERSPFYYKGDIQIGMIGFDLEREIPTETTLLTVRIRDPYDQGLLLFKTMLHQQGIRYSQGVLYQPPHPYEIEIDHQLRTYSPSHTYTPIGTILQVILQISQRLGFHHDISKWQRKFYKQLKKKDLAEWYCDMATEPSVTIEILREYVEIPCTTKDGRPCGQLLCLRNPTREEPTHEHTRIYGGTHNRGHIPTQEEMHALQEERIRTRQATPIAWLGPRYQQEEFTDTDALFFDGFPYPMAEEQAEYGPADRAYRALNRARALLVIWRRASNFRCHEIDTKANVVWYLPENRPDTYRGPRDSSFRKVSWSRDEWNQRYFRHLVQDHAAVHYFLHLGGELPPGESDPKYPRIRRPKRFEHIDELELLFARYASTSSLCSL